MLLSIPNNIKPKFRKSFINCKKVSMCMDFKIDTVVRKDDNYKTIIINRNGLEWIPHPEIKLNQCFNFIPLKDCKTLIQELNNKEKIRIFSCDDYNAYRYKNLLSYYNFDCQVI